MKKFYFLLLCLSLCSLLYSQEDSNVAFNNSLVVKYFKEGFYDNGVLTISARPEYSKLDFVSKQNAIGCFLKRFPNCHIVVKLDGGDCELWKAKLGELYYVEYGKHDHLDLSTYQPQKKKHRTPGGYFYSINSALSWSSENMTDSYGLRAGTFLNNRKQDGAVSINYSSSGYGDDKTITFNVGVSSRYYLYGSNNPRIFPYVGGGYSWTYASASYFEWQILGGFCFMLGPGSIDAGVNYGKTSGFSATIGYTFRPNF